MTVTIGQFDETLRDTVGRMDRLEFALKQLEERINVINKDIDIRLKMLEGKPFDTDGLGTAKVPEKKFLAPVAKMHRSRLWATALQRVRICLRLKR